MAHVLFSTAFVLLFCIQITSIQMQSVRINESEYKSRRKCLGEDTLAVCGWNGRKMTLFHNKCIMEEENRINTNNIAFKEVPIGFCEKNCDLVCSTVYKPICAIDIKMSIKRNFNNHCEMVRDRCLTNTSWTQYRSGACVVSTNEPIDAHKKENRKSKRSNRGRSMACTKIYNPVCATLYGVKSTFINECSVFAENKKTGRDWQIFSHGVCAEDSALATQMSARTNTLNTENNIKTQNREKMVSNNYNTPTDNISSENHKINHKPKVNNIKHNKSNIMFDSIPTMEQHSTETDDIIEDILQGKENNVRSTVSVPVYVEPNRRLQVHYKVNKIQNINPTKQRLPITEMVQRGESNIVAPNMQASASLYPNYSNLKKDQFSNPSNVFTPLAHIAGANIPQTFVKQLITPNTEQIKLVTMINQLPNVAATRGGRATVANILPYSEELSIGRKFERNRENILNQNRFYEQNRKLEEPTLTISNSNGEKNRMSADRPILTKMPNIFDSAPNINSPENTFNKEIVFETIQRNNEHGITNKREPVELISELSDSGSESQPQPTSKQQVYYTIKDNSKPMLIKGFKTQNYQTKSIDTLTNTNTMMQNHAIVGSKFPELDQQFPKSIAHPPNFHTHMEAYNPKPIRASNMNYHNYRSSAEVKTANAPQQMSKNEYFLPPPLIQNPLNSFHGQSPNIPLQPQPLQPQPLPPQPQPLPAHPLPLQPSHWEPQSKHFNYPYSDFIKSCPIGVKPICAMLGSKTRNFNNYCEMLHRKNYYREDWLYLHEGKCPLACNDIHCSMTYAPMCVSWNGLKYTIFNECHYTVARCQDQLSDWKVISNGECQMDIERIIDHADEKIVTTSTQSTISVTTPPPKKSKAKPKDPKKKGISSPLLTKKESIKPIIRKSTVKVVLIQDKPTESPIMRVISQNTTSAAIILTTKKYKAIETTTAVPTIVTTVKTVNISSSPIIANVSIAKIIPTIRKSSDYNRELIEKTTEKPTNSLIQVTSESTTLESTTIKTIDESSTLPNRLAANSHSSIPSKRPSIYGPHLSSYIMRLLVASQKKNVK